MGTMRIIHGCGMRAGVIILALVAWALPAVAAPDKGVELEFTYYYRAPDPQRVPALFGRLDSLESPMPDDADWPCAMFLAEILAKNPEVAETLIRDKDGHSPRWRYTVALAARQAGLPDSRKYVGVLLPEPELEPIRAEMLESEFRPLQEVPVDNETVLDALWGAFMASGNVAYVERVIGALGYSLENGKKAVTRVQIAARWSLASNASQHPLVLETCRKAVASGTLSAETQDVLLSVIRNAEEMLSLEEKT